MNLVLTNKNHQKTKKLNWESTSREKYYNAKKIDKINLNLNREEKLKYCVTYTIKEALSLEITWTIFWT